MDAKNLKELQEKVAKAEKLEKAIDGCRQLITVLENEGNYRRLEVSLCTNASNHLDYLSTALQLTQPELYQLLQAPILETLKAYLPKLEEEFKNL